MADPVLYGAAYSAYTRVARLVLAEKGVAYRLEELDVFAPGGPPRAYLEVHPFGRIPALVHDGFVLYETAAIGRYVDEAFAGPSLQPRDVRGRARVAQLVGILDAYAYRPMVWDIFVERVRNPLTGERSDETKIAAAVTHADRTLGVLEGFMGGGSWLAGGGDGPSLADLHAAPMLAYLGAALEGAALLASHPRILGWWERISRRPSMLATPTPLIAPHFVAG